MKKIDLYVYFPDATYPGNHYGLDAISFPVTSVFTSQFIEREKIELGKFIDLLFDDPDCLEIWGAKSLVTHGYPEWIELRLTHDDRQLEK